MAQPYTIRMAAAVLTQVAAGERLNIVPYNQRWIVRDVVFYNASPNPLGLTLFIRTGGGDFVAASAQLDAFTSHHLELRQAMYYNNELIGSQTALGGSMLVTGYSLDEGLSPQP